MSSKMQFHDVTGPSIKLSSDKLSACRIKPIEEFDNGWVFSEKYLNVNEEFQIQILHLISTHYQSLQFGVTLEKPADLNENGFLSQNEIFKNSWMLQNDKFYYRNDDNIITTEEYDINLSLLQEGDLLGIKINEKRELCFTQNGIPFRAVAEDIPQNVWAFVNLYGKCSFITLIPPKSPITTSQKQKMIEKLRSTKENTNANDENEISFHDYCGKEVSLSECNKVAQRKNPTNEFRNAVVISNKPLVTNQTFKLRIEGLINKWNGSIEFGVTIHNPDSFELPATMTNLRSGTLVLSGNSILTNGHGNQLPYSATSLDDLMIADEIAVRRNTDGDINFFINQKDLGVAGNIAISVDIWVIIDLYGRTIKVSIPTNQPKSTSLNLETVLNLQSEVDNRLIFNPVCGRNILITQGGYSASRINDQEFNNGIVFTQRPMKIGDRWTVKLVRCVDQWAGNLEMGITTVFPSELDLPSTMTDLSVGYTIMLTSNGLVINGCPLSQSDKSIDLENIHSVLLTGIPSLIEGSTLGVEIIDDDKIQFFINNADLGIVTFETNKDIYGVIDLYGKAAEVSIHTNDIRNSIARVSNAVKSESSNTVDYSENEIKPNFDGLLFSDDNSDFDRHSDHEQLETGLNEMLLDADRSFLRLLTSNDNFAEESRSYERQPMHFHPIHGRNVILSNEGRTAYRPSPNNEFKNALVMSSRPLVTDELFEICVEKMTDHWSGSLEMGVTLIRPEELNFPGTLSQLDKDCWILSGSCLMNNGITARNDYGLDMDNIHVNSKIGVIRRQSGMLHFLLDGIDMGSAYFDVPMGIYVILDLYGQCSQVSITNKTGISLSSELAIVSINPRRDLSDNLLSRDQEEPLSLSGEGLKLPSIQYISALEKTMSAIKRNLSSTSETITGLKSINLINDSDLIIEDSSDQTIEEEKSLQMNSFFCNCIYGIGVASYNMGNFFTHNQSLNCVIQFKEPLKTNVYYELLFWNDKNNGHNLEPISFGIISSMISSDRYLPDNLTLVKSPSWVISGGRLFINNSLRNQSFAPTLTRYKNRMFVGLYFYDNSNLEVFVDQVSVGKIVTDIHQECFLIINLRGWFNSLLGLGVSPKPNGCLSQPNASMKMPNYSLKNQSDFPSVNNEESLFSEQQIANLNDNLDIEDPLITAIVNELSTLLPLFFIIMDGIDTSKLTSKIVTSNNDIVLYVRKRLISKNSFLKLANQTALTIQIKNQLIDELSHRFSQLSELRNLGNSKFEIARVLRRRVLWNKVTYDDKKSAFIIRESCLILEESKISRLKSGSEFGLCILNQELKSKKFSSYEVQLIHNDSLNGSESKNEPNTSIIGLILLENNHFPNTEDVFRFLMNISCPRHVHLFPNTLNHHLELKKFESKAALLIIEEDSVYFNGRKICHRLPFNTRSLSSDNYLSFVIVDSEQEIADIYLSIRSNESTMNYKIFSQTWLKATDIIRTVYPSRNVHYYVPFVWLKNQSMAIIRTEPKNKSMPIGDMPQTNHQDWLEKHYHDELNKESNHSTIRGDLTFNQQCIYLLRSVVIRKALALPDMYFYNRLADCFCNNCHYPISGGNIDLAKEFRSPFGWMKFHTRLKKEEKHYLSVWKLAYLTVSSGLLHRLLSSANPINVLTNFDNLSSSQISWLKSPTSPGVLSNNSIVVSPWQPLTGGYLNDDDSINQCTDCFINCFDPLTNSEIKARIALEVRVKPNSYKNTECKILTENQSEIKRIVLKDIEGCANKKVIDCHVVRPISQKTVWILNGEENSIVISGLLMKI